MDYKVPLLFVLSIVNLALAQGVVKTWSQNNNWGTLNNWHPPRLPCQNDIVTIERENSAMLIDAETAMKEIVFPNTGSLSLGPSAQLKFPGKLAKPSTCKGEVVSFKGPTTSNWFDPRNWQTTKTSASLYPWQIPCQYDTIKFPKESSFDITLESNVTISRLFVGDTELSREEFDDYIKSKTDLRQIKLAPYVTITMSKKECTIQSGCTCGYTKKMKNFICDLLGECTELQCQRRVRPNDACCPICGQLMVLNVTNDFQKKSMDEAITTYLDKYPNVTYHLVNIEDNVLQLVLESTKNDDLDTVVAYFKKIFDENKDVLKTKVLPDETTVVTAKSSGSSGRKLYLALGLGIPIFVIIITVMLAICWSQRNQTRKQKGFEEGEGNEGTPKNNGDFINPLYEPSIEMGSVGRSNPLYDVTPPTTTTTTTTNEN